MLDKLFCLYAGAMLTLSQLLFSKLMAGSYNRGGQYNRRKDIFISNLNTFTIDNASYCHGLGHIAKSTQERVQYFEAPQRAIAALNRRKRKFMQALNSFM